MTTTAQREFWNGQPAALETVWTLSKRHRIPRLILYTHQLGWECAGRVRRTARDAGLPIGSGIEDVSAGWKEAMIEKGWSEHVNDTAID